MQLALPTRPTSVRCLAEIEARGLLSRQRLTVYKALLEHGPMTGAEVDRFQHEGRGHLHKRLSELEARGLARVAGERRCTVTGHLAITWEAIDRLPADAPARPTRLEAFSQALVERMRAEPDRTWTAAEVADLVKEMSR